ncbi:hypothetical protein BDZ89DRAFT_1051068 [Hymenopellis radicata]|nr:hypothetical protein BDZ89DRAFT_1051068 [Hymenopellis radicata]
MVSPPASPRIKENQPALRTATRKINIPSISVAFTWSRTLATRKHCVPDCDARRHPTVLLAIAPIPPGNAALFLAQGVPFAAAYTHRNVQLLDMEGKYRVLDGENEAVHGQNDTSADAICALTKGCTYFDVACGEEPKWVMNVQLEGLEQRNTYLEQENRVSSIIGAGRSRYVVLRTSQGWQVAEKELSRKFTTRLILGESRSRVDGVTYLVSIWRRVNRPEDYGVEDVDDILVEAGAEDSGSRREVNSVDCAALTSVLPQSRRITKTTSPSDSKTVLHLKFQDSRFIVVEGLVVLEYSEEKVEGGRVFVGWVPEYDDIYDGSGDEEEVLVVRPWRFVDDVDEESSVDEDGIPATERFCVRTSLESAIFPPSNGNTDPPAVVRKGSDPRRVKHFLWLL